MKSGGYYTTRRLILHSLRPSATSLVGGFSVAILLLLLGALLQSSNKGAPFANALGDVSVHWVAYYHELVTFRLDQLFGDPTVNTILVGVFWALLGLVLYAVVLAVAGFVHNLREDSQDIVYARPEMVAHHPLRRSLILQAVWRSAIAVLAAVATILLVPLLGFISSRADELLYKSGASPTTMLNLALVIVLIMAVIHVYVVFVRLFLMRTRVFGELLH